MAFEVNLGSGIRARAAIMNIAPLQLDDCHCILYANRCDDDTVECHHLFWFDQYKKFTDTVMLELGIASGQLLYTMKSFSKDIYTIQCCQ